MRFGGKFIGIAALVLIVIFSIGYSYFSSCHYFCCKLGIDIESCVFTIDINLPVALAAFYGVVLGFLVPLSKKEIRETKESVPEHLIEDFEKKTNIVLMVKSLAVGLVSSVILIFFFKQFEANILLNWLTFIALCYFIFIVWIVFEFSRALHGYTITQKIFDMLEEEVKNAIRK
jgi:hypothetical protein